MSQPDGDRDHRPRQVMGIPVGPGGWRRKPDDEEQGFVLGLPRSWFRRPDDKTDWRWLRHPVRWSRWRRQVQKLGPYAPGYSGTGPTAKRT
jgi:hypothetical protein